MAKIDIEAIKAQNPLEIVIGGYVELQANGPEFKGLCPFHKEKTPSFTVVPDKDFYHCFGCGANGDVVGFVMDYHGTDFKGAVEILTNGAAPGGDLPPVQRETRHRVDHYAGYEPLPVPDNAPLIVAGKRTPDIWNPKRADDKPIVNYTPSMVHPYYQDGVHIGYVIRQDISDGGKLTPSIRWVRDMSGEENWSHFPMPRPRPLYRLPELLVDTDKPVLWVEGEACADVAGVLAAYVAVSCGGTGTIKHTDLTPLKDRAILIWPDNDEVGIDSVNDVLIPLLWSVGAASIKLIGSDDTKPNKWDIKDAIAEGMDGAAIIAWAKQRLSVIEPPLPEEIEVPAHKLPDVQSPTGQQLADARGYKVEDDADQVLAALCEQYVYVRSEDSVYRVDEPDLAMGRGAFKFSFPQKNFDKKRPTAAECWGTDPRRMVVDKRFFTPVDYWIIGNTLNIYRPPDHVAPTGTPDEFIKLIEHLLENSTEREWFTQWLAYKTQNLQERGVAVVMVAKNHGTGRGTLQRIMAQIFGQRYVQSVSMAHVTGQTSQSQYNEWQSESLFVFVAETKSQASSFKNRSATYETIKDVVDPGETWAHINHKHIQNTYERVYVSILFMCNHMDTIAIPPEDRRLVVLENVRKLKPKQWQTIEAWRQKPENISAALDWLKNYDVAGFDFGVSIETAAKMEMIDSSKSGLDVAIEFASMSMPGKFCTMYQIEAFIKENQRSESWSLSENWERVLKKIVVQKIVKACKNNPRWQVRVDGRNTTIYSLRGKQFDSEEIDTAMIKAEVDKNGAVREVIY